MGDNENNVNGDGAMGNKVDDDGDGGVGGVGGGGSDDDDDDGSARDRTTTRRPQPTPRPTSILPAAVAGSTACCARVFFVAAWDGE